MKALFTLLALVPVTAFSQQTWQVEAGGSTAPGSTTAPYYDPMDLTINVGDAVHWDAVSGSHNVYGELDDFPQNPEGFSSGEPSQDLNYTKTFTIPGLYGFHCTQQGHAQTQHGTILVLNSQGVHEQTPIGSLLLFPIPASGQLTVELEGGDLLHADVIGVDGRVFRSSSLVAGKRNIINVDGLAAGRYLLRLIDTNGHSLVRPFIKD